MSLILVTGQPGSGKTACVVDMLAHDDQFQGRPIFVMGVPDLTIDHVPCPPIESWTEFKSSPEDESISLAYFTFPENALVVLDEAQRVYRPRPAGSKVPPEVAAFETHRHLGIDFILITQHPGLIDANIRKLIGRHIHIRVTPLGRYKYQWTELGDPESPSSREIAAREKYQLPKRAFSLYKSSQLHTKIKTKIPWFVWLFVIGAISAAALGWYAYQRVTSKVEAKPTTEEKRALTSAANHKQTAEVKTVAEYAESLVPRVAGMYHTAPRYDDITKPVDAPWPSLCYVSRQGTPKESCKCYDQQGNRYKTNDATCYTIVENGIFKDWQGSEDLRAQHEKKSSPPVAQTKPVEVPPELFQSRAI